MRLILRKDWDLQFAWALQFIQKPKKIFLWFIFFLRIVYSRSKIFLMTLLRQNNKLFKHLSRLFIDWKVFVGNFFIIAFIPFFYYNIKILLCLEDILIILISNMITEKYFNRSIQSNFSISQITYLRFGLWIFSKKIKMSNKLLLNIFLSF